MALGKLLDYSQARPPLTSVKRAGYSAVYRYVCSDRAEAGLPGKRLTPRERDQILAAGLDIGLHGEDDARAALGGYARGLAQGRQWAGYAHSVLAAPKGMTIVAAIDYDTLGAYPLIVQEYLGGIDDGMQHEYLTGVYGSIYVVDGALRADHAMHGVQTSAWSHGKISQLAEVYQHGGSEFAGTDYNDVLRIPHGTWLQTLAGDDMTPEQEKLLQACYDRLGLIIRGDDPDPVTGDTHPANLTNLLGKLGSLSAVAIDLHGEIDDLKAAIAQLQPGTAGGPVSGAVSGTLTITPAAS